MLKFVERKWWYFGFSGLLIVPGLIFLLLGGLKPGIEFKGGTLLDVRFDTPPTVAEVTEVMTGLGRREAVVQVAEGGRIEVRTFEMKPDELVATEAALRAKFGTNVKDVNPSVVSPSFSGELIDNAVRSIALASVLIVLLIAFAFRNFGWAAFRYGIAAIISLLHDAAVVLGLFAILGYLFNVEIDSLFVTAVLTIIGFSVHDTIVVFDRIRENRIRHAGEPFGAIVNHSILQTIGRSINTSLTVVVTLAALLLLGPVTIRTFTLALLIGVVSGTYSSIFNASQLLVAWYEWDAQRKARAGVAKPVRPLSR